MGKSHYSFKKRQKELARKLKQEEKRQRKLDKGKIEPGEDLERSQKPEGGLDESQDKVEDPLT
jgi:hypothetical protein